MNTQAMSPEQSPLGKTVSYQDHYAPGLLFPIPRQVKRDEIGVDAAALPFAGVDIWTGFELSWLNARGKPQVGIATFRIPADSPNLIESKSFKLYLNSYNQTRMAGLDALRRQLADDLSAAAGKPIGVDIMLPQQFGGETIAEPAGDCIDDLDIEVDNYAPCPQILRADAGEVVSETLCSHLLKSNCLVTGQPDWGSVQIRYTGPRLDREALLRYLIGFRQHNEFHEQCVERIFTDLLRACAPSRLTVYARYTRRGGLDINPFRSNCGEMPVGNTRTARQ
ncbi:7-cyano-7-deazaguanine reductase [Chromobacterium alkanivorans]|uniref:NADPH-dependent 7-cyano-7-deazaguanine reductase QueF n=1 Tax=Chromobacterium alkanivorans TaxID=1071719 RepID=UPI002166D552|nr:NADPH-dependent 7-cyano-7-deazaguanine reductase QueF [Chromobacterium alkanivorans]MCS3805159.1 7-cyano-7-deazaguanine reductase [Chromobacterium alkanivorans]MCS3819278.1 7-cyano-7-deazaguanine reductase [Chromobacterium alkanivorans]MCS3873790.1 7-cyano-7-deazaguanine reductase [Chromobacterium alkanivorans]